MGRMSIQKIADDIKALKLHPATGEEYDAGYQAARHDAWLIAQEAADDVLDVDPIEIINGFLAWSEEPDPSSKSVRHQQLCEVWAKARSFLSTPHTPTGE